MTTKIGREPASNCIVEYVPLRMRTDELLGEFSNKLREVFSNTPYNQYLLNPHTKDSLSPQEVFDTGDYVRGKDLDSLDIDNTENAFWLNPEKTLSILSHKLTKPNSFLTVAKDSKIGAILGGTFGYVSDLRDIFYNCEEWNDPYLYSGLDLTPDIGGQKIKRFLSSIEESLDKFQNNIIKLQHNTQFMVWNCVFLAPEARGKGVFYEVMGKLASNIPEHLDTMPLIAEVIKYTKAHKLFAPAKFIETSYSLGKDHPVIIQQTKNFKDIFPSFQT